MVGVPTYDRRIDIDQAKGLLQLERAGYELDLVFPVSSHISRNRNYIVSEFLKSTNDWLLFWDSDIGLEEGFLDKMFDTAYKHDAQIVCGAYKMKKEGSVYVLGEQKPDKTYHNLTEVFGVREVDAGGTGIMLIHRTVLETLEEPWFTIKDGKNLFVMPEDFLFCEKAKKEGFKIMADARFSTNHYGTQPFHHEKS